jgi:hypothetical protein
MNDHAPSEDDGKDTFYVKLQCVFDKFHKYNMKILLDFNTKVGREESFKPTIGNESLLEICNVNGVRLVNCATSKILRVRCSHIATS